ncbi:hypothetical protein ACFQNJ_01835 [Hydrogenophaga bisanensis]|uniref:Uncharacterized protein n=1 Tax=Hydrogenophaga bisanensis TaxID=439611 RepID=A0ABW2R489_9BURK
MSVRSLLTAALGAAAVGTALLAPALVSAQTGAIVISAKEGGKNPGFCMPQWSISNETGKNVGALLVQVEWRTRGGKVLEPAAALGSIIEPFAAGRKKDLSMNGYTAACSDLQLVVRSYACRDANAVRMACPGPLRADAQGVVGIDLASAKEGPMKGATEQR